MCLFYEDTPEGNERLLNALLARDQAAQHAVEQAGVWRATVEDAKELGNAALLRNDVDAAINHYVVGVMWVEVFIKDCRARGDPCAQDEALCESLNLTSPSASTAWEDAWMYAPGSSRASTRGTPSSFAAQPWAGSGSPRLCTSSANSTRRRATPTWRSSWNRRTQLSASCAQRLRRLRPFACS
ncbi:hypothetical protein T492DRAFT_1098191 [Pavlovales sp. CCMP2436]|nr:hypothetical protein T492DRAFT_1098191 [Pavlovales sp. CCMP2436]